MSVLVVIVQVEGEPALVLEVDTKDMNIGGAVRKQALLRDQRLSHVAVIVEYRGE